MAKLSWMRVALVGVALTATTACRDTTTPGDSANADAHREVLASVADHVVVPLTGDFVSATAALQSAAASYATDVTPAKRDEVRARWTEAMTVWQQLELLQVGPAGLMGDVAGGESLRDLIYSWPVVNSCRIDQETAREGYGDLSAALPNVRGLDALEYLLFATSTQHTCSAGSAFATAGEWEAIGDASAVTARRAAHAAAVASDLAATAGRLRTFWDPAGTEGFRDKFANAGVDTSVYATAQEGLNALSDAMFYLEKETKDMKLAVPAGVLECTETVCPDARESLFANLSKGHIVTNLNAFRRIFAGGTPGAETVGFDDLLVAMGQGALAQRLDDELVAAIAAVEAVPGTLLEALGTAPQTVVAAYDAVRIPVTTFRTEVLSVLDLELPQRAEGDND